MATLDFPLKKWFAASMIGSCLFLTAAPLSAQTKDGSLRGVVLVGDKNQLLTGPDLESANSLQSTVFIPGGKDRLKDALDPYLCSGVKATAKTVTEIRDAIKNYYIDQGYPFTLVIAPKEGWKDGVVQYIVIQSTLENVSVQGNDWNSRERIENYIRSKPGDPIDVARLSSDVNFINTNPFRRADLVYTAGPQTGTTDLSVVMQERRPYRFYMGFDNTGIETTKRERMFAGFNFANALFIDSVLSFQFTTSYNFNNFKSYTGQYLIYLPWRHTVNFYGGYSSVKADLSLPSTGNSGSSAQASFRYEIPFMFSPRYAQEFSFGADWKNTNNSIEFSDLFIAFSQPVNLFQLMLGYEGERVWPKARVNLDAEVYGSPGEWLPDQSNSDYNSLRPDAKNQYLYAKAALGTYFELPREFSLSLLLRGQASSTNLLPSEQIGIGGYDTVRGYEERQLNYDMGFIANLEARSPAFSFFKRKGNSFDALQLLAFLDYGAGRNHDLLPGEPISEYLLGAGPGARYTLDPYIAIRLDWGVKLHHKEIYEGGWSMIHFSAVVSY